MIREKDLQTNELYHYGVKGMKWGVRRYQNKGGSYTRSGIKRFEKSASDYDANDQLYKTLKKNKREKGNSFDLEVRDAKGNEATLHVKDASGAMKLAKQSRKNAKTQMKKDYKHLKQDLLADQGKKLYSEGYRITDNVGSKLISAGATVATVSGYLYASKIIDQKQATALGSIGGATSLIGTGISYMNYNKDRKLRAYYGHSSRY